MNERNDTEATPKSTRRSLPAKIAAAVGAVALLIGGGFLTLAGPAEARRWVGGHHSCSHDHGPMGERSQWIAGRMLDRVDATDEQRATILGIIDETTAELEKTRSEHAELRDAVVAQLTGPSVDRAALERLRASKVRALDETSERVVIALADIAEALSPDQRMQIAERVSHWRR